MRHGLQQRKSLLILPLVAFEHNWENREDIGQMGIEVEIVLQMSHNTLTRAEEYI